MQLYFKPTVDSYRVYNSSILELFPLRLNSNNTWKYTIAGRIP